MRLNKRELLILIGCMVLSVFIVIQAQSIRHGNEGEVTDNGGFWSRPKDEKPEFCSSVDVVYTWVNGSDPAHRELLKKYGRGGWDGGYRDYGVIKYSARSIAKFMPWVRNIIIITNGQIPNWVDTSSPRLRIITHDQIFDDPTNLPTFNSNAIEANIRNIPGLAPCLLYLNDDMFLAAPLSKDTFFDREGHLKLPMSKGFIAPMVEKMKHNTWHQLMGHSNDVLNSYYYPNAVEPVKHAYPAHVCYFMRRDILELIGKRWHDDIAATSAHRFRQSDDTQTPFMAANVALEEFGAKKQNLPGLYGTWTTDKEKNDAFWKKVWGKTNICVCMNDNLDNTPEGYSEIDRLQRLFEEKLPEKSFIEK